MPTLTLAERQSTLQEQLRTRRAKLAEARTAVESLQTQCAQLEGALALCAALIGEAPAPTPDMFDKEEDAA